MYPIELVLAHINQAEFDEFDVQCQGYRVMSNNIILFYVLWGPYLTHSIYPQQKCRTNILRLLDTLLPHMRILYKRLLSDDSSLSYITKVRPFFYILTANFLILFLLYNVG